MRRLDRRAWRTVAGPVWVFDDERLGSLWVLSQWLEKPDRRRLKLDSHVAGRDWKKTWSRKR
jgi:hypothetical protein